MSPSQQPLVSIIIGSYNAGEYLRPAVESVLGQTYRNLEVLIVDDGSTDGSVEGISDIKETRLRIIRQENRGRPATLNRALSEARGDFYAIQDADDLSYPHRVERLVQGLLNNPELAAVFSGHELILDGRRLAPRFRAMSVEECKRTIERFAIPAHDPTGMFRMSLVRDLKYDTELPYTEAVDYILRVGERHPIMVLGECLYSYRIHSASITRRDPATRRGYVIECCRRACRRRGMNFDEQFPGADAPVNKLRNRDFDNNLAAQFMESTLDQRRAGRFAAAMRTGLQCAQLHPLDPHYHKALMYAITPWWLIRRLRRSGGC